MKKISEIFMTMFNDNKEISENYIEIFRKYNFHIGRMISGSKSAYLDRYPEHLVIFNANIFTKKSGKIWFGDLDVTLDFDNLKEIADELNEDLYILREMDGRFENENIKFKEVKKVAVEIIKCKK